MIDKYIFCIKFSSTKFEGAHPLIITITFSTCRIQLNFPLIPNNDHVENIHFFIFKVDTYVEPTASMSKQKV